MTLFHLESMMGAEKFQKHTQLLYSQTACVCIMSPVEVSAQRMFHVKIYLHKAS